MIKRYSRAPMLNIWSEQNKFEAFLKVEILATEAWSKLGVVPAIDAEKIAANAKFDLKRIAQLEEETKHDVIAFTRAVSESLGDERKWVHYGLTSTDVVDTANGYLFKQANDILLADLEALAEVLGNQALKYRNTPCIGRTHGIHADITCFGLKFALWYEQIKRNIARFKAVRKEVECGKISGAVGNFANIPPFVEEYVCQKLKIANALISTQILQRDRHAYYMATLSVIATTLEQMATEIRNLQRTEIGEVEEAFSKGQKGSSAMPHKRNPIASENICGCARVMRGYMVTAYEDVALWNERDISHSSAERIIIPDAVILLDYMLNRFKDIVANLVVYKDRMLQNIYKTNGVIFSQRVMNALISKGSTREEAYDLVQPLAMRAYNEQRDFKELLKGTDAINKLLSATELESCFTLEYYLKNVSTIYKRIGLGEEYEKN